MTLHSIVARRHASYCIAWLQKARSRTLIFIFLMLLTFNNIYAQSTVVVKGIITHQNGDPITGASVVVKSTGKGTMTLADGSFQLEAPINSTLVITHTGFVGQELKLTGANQSGLAIRLIETENSAVFITGN